jgi:hypothetical protein
MDTEQTIAEIERLERIFVVPDTRPLNASDLWAANRRHDERSSRSCSINSASPLRAWSPPMPPCAPCWP